jgi:hypothetical protein
MCTVAAGSSGGQRLSLADEVAGTGHRGAADAAGGCECWLFSYVRRGKGQEGLDVFEITAARHETSETTRKLSPYHRDRPDGWESVVDIERWTERRVDKNVLLSK